MTSVLVNSGYGEPPRKKNTDLRINENKLERCGRLLSVDMRTLHHPITTQNQKAVRDKN